MCAPRSTALSTSTSLRDLLDASIAYTGDVDTVATIALGAGSCAADVEHNLPPELDEASGWASAGRRRTHPPVRGRS